MQYDKDIKLNQNIYQVFFRKDEQISKFFNKYKYVYSIFQHKIKNILKSENDQIAFDLFLYIHKYK